MFDLRKELVAVIQQHMADKQPIAQQRLVELIVERHLSNLEYVRLCCRRYTEIEATRLALGELADEDEEMTPEQRSDALRAHAEEIEVYIAERRAASQASTVDKSLD